MKGQRTDRLVIGLVLIGVFGGGDAPVRGSDPLAPAPTPATAGPGSKPAPVWPPVGGGYPIYPPTSDGLGPLPLPLAAPPVPAPALPAGPPSHVPGPPPLTPLRNPLGVWRQANGCYTVTGPEQIQGAPAHGAPDEIVCPPFLLYFNTEYLLWQVSRQRVPALLTAGAFGQTSAVPGALGAPGTDLVLGNGLIGTEPRAGVRFTLGGWFSESQVWGLEGSYFVLENRPTRFFAAGGDPNDPTAPVLSRPFFNSAVGLQSSDVIGVSNLQQGHINVALSSQVNGAEVNLRRNLWAASYARLDMLVGVRYLSLNESLSFYEQFTTLPAPTGLTISIFDRFATQNEYYGGQVGFLAQAGFKRWMVDLRSTAALGETRQQVSITGGTQQFTPNGNSLSFPNGFLAQPTNIGVYRRNRMGVVSDSRITFGYHLTDHLRLFAGYDFLYWGSVVRPGEQINTNINASQLPTAAGPGKLVGAREPNFTFHQSDTNIQGFTLGIDLHY